MTKTHVSPYILEVRTVQSSPIKTLIEGIKDLLTECCLNFDDTGLKIVSMDSSHVVLVHLKLDANNFEFYHIKYPEVVSGVNRVTIGVNMIYLHKIIRTINSHDSLTLFLEQTNMNYLGITIENGERNSKTTYKFSLMDLDDTKVSVDPAEFNTVITLPSADFQKILRDMSNITEKIEIKNIGNQLILSCKGEFCDQETVLVDNENGVNRIDNRGGDEIVQGIFNLKYLVLFTKCTNLSNTVELFLKNDYPGSQLSFNLYDDLNYGMKSTVPTLVCV